MFYSIKCPVFNFIRPYKTKQKMCEKSYVRNSDGNCIQIFKQCCYVMFINRRLQVLQTSLNIGDKTRQASFVFSDFGVLHRRGPFISDIFLKIE